MRDGSAAMTVRVERDLDGVTAALRDALDGGPAVLPAPTEGVLAVARPDEPVDDDIALLVGTSGSTAAPKVVELTAAALRASAAGTDEALGGPGNWLLCLPFGYIAGVQVIVRTLLSGSALHILPDGPFRSSAFCAAVDAMPAGRRYVSLVPTQLRRLLDDPDGLAALVTFAGVLVGGAATPPALLSRARAAGVAVRTTYGMSETAGGCVYDGVPLRGANASLDDEGRITLGGPMLARRYRNNPGDTSTAFVDGGFRTSDLGRIDHGVLHVLGRIDDVVVTGGRKVLPSEVATAAASVDGVVDVYVTGVPDPEWGSAVTAWLVLDGADVDDVRSAVREQVGAHAVPRSVHLVESIPLLSSGKPDRLRLLASLG